MIVFGIYNIVISLALIFYSKHLIKNVNEDIKQDEKDKKYYNNDRLNKSIKSDKRYKLFIYIVIFICILVILGTLLLLTINYLEVL